MNGAPTIRGAQETEAMLGGYGSAHQSAELEARNPLMGASVEDRIHGKQGRDLAAAAEGVYAEWMSERAGREREWFEALSFYAGEQYCVWNTSRQILKPRGRAPKWVIRRVLNETKPVVQHVVSILTKGNPYFRTHSANNTSRDALGSKAANAALHYSWRHFRYAKARRACAKLKTITGTAAHELEWDGFGGAYKAMGPGIGGMSEPAGPMMGGTDTLDASGMTPPGLGYDDKEGTLKRNLLTCFNLCPDPKATGDDDGEALIVLKEIGINRLKAIYPEAAEYLRPESIAASNLGMNYLQQFQTMAARFHWRTSGATNRNSMLVKTMYLPRSPRYPRGRMIVFGNYVLLHEGDNPVYSGELSDPEPSYRWPVFVYRHDWDGVSFWGRGLVPDLVDVQRTINQTYSKSVSIIYTMANPKWLVAHQHGGKKIQITDEPGQVIRTPMNMKAADAVAVVRGSDLPSTVMQLISISTEKMERIAGIRESTAGGQPSARASGRSLDIQRSQDSARLEPVRLEDAETLEQELTHCLELLRRYWSEEKTVKVTGRNLRTAVEVFKGSDIQSGTSVEIEEEFELRATAEARAMIVNAAVQSRLLNPDDPIDKHRALEMMGMGGSARRYELERDVDRECGHRENEKLSRGQVETDDYGVPDVRVEPWYDHAIHIDVHRTFMSTQEYEELPPDVQAQFEAHLYEHVYRLEAQVAGQNGQTGLAGTEQEQGGGPPMTAPMPGGPPQQEGVTPQ